jgi:hypothetical protein
MRGLLTCVAFYKSYLESGGEGAIVKPWVWILFIALSPISYAILWQLYIHLSVIFSFSISNFNQALKFF